MQNIGKKLGNILEVRNHLNGLRNQSMDLGINILIVFIERKKD
jgi:hypothetical protein